ncbi:MAG TPA: DUF116 domain-containing protein, partial [Methanomicrobiales archaeon]|nr:DUF116 domain-containing protein [Methanomicrobiales archaeon]
MFFEPAVWNQLMILIGEITVIILLAILLMAGLIVTTTLYSIKSGRLYFAQLLTPGLVAMEG